jgi:O-antigen/teichoic acid export membrane protein
VSALARNALLSMAQSVVSAALLFALFRFLSATLSVADVGLWALVVSSTATGRVAELGFGAGVVRFVARATGEGDRVAAAVTIANALAGVAVLVGLGCVVLRPVLAHVLASALAGHGPDRVAAAHALLMPALVSLWIGTIAAIPLSGLDGVQRMDVRSIVLILGGAVQFGLVMALAPTYGLMGVVWAQIGQALFTLAVGLPLVVHYLATPARLWLRWSWTRQLELVKYGGPLQISAVAQLFYEPAVKGLLAAFGTLDLVGFYEMASRLIGQLRLVLLAGAQAMVPHAAKVVRSLENAREIYARTHALMLPIVLAAFGVLVASLPLVLTVWLGRYDDDFIAIGAILAAAWALNTAAAPGYLLMVATGRLTAPVISHVVVGTVASAAGFVLGRAGGGMGVVAGAACGLLAGTAVVACATLRWLDVRWRDLLSATTRGPIALTVAFAGVGFATLASGRAFATPSVASTGITLAAVAAIVCAWVLSPAIRVYAPLFRVADSNFSSPDVR